MSALFKDLLCVSKTTRKTKITCHCEERSDVAIRIPLGLCKVLVRRKENGFPRRASPSRDGGIPRFIDLPPSPFRGNDKGFLYIELSFPYWQFIKTGDPSVD